MDRGMGDTWQVLGKHMLALCIAYVRGQGMTSRAWDGVDSQTSTKASQSTANSTLMPLCAGAHYARPSRPRLKLCLRHVADVLHRITPWLIPTHALTPLLHRWG